MVKHRIVDFRLLTHSTNEVCFVLFVVISEAHSMSQVNEYLYKLQFNNGGEEGLNLTPTVILTLTLLV